jgi:VWFA-related protein
MKPFIHPVVMCCLGLLIALAGPARLESRQTPAQQPAPGTGDAQQEQQPIFRTGINFVRVDAIVTDRQGNPVTDLEASDFEVFENGQPQTVESFRLVNIDGAADGTPPRQIRSRFDVETEAAREDVRVVAILLDDYHVRLGASMRIREPLMRFVQQQLSPNDLVAVMYPLTALSELDFTRNHDAIASAISRFEGRKFNYEPRNQFEERYAYYPAATVERIRNQVTLSALQALVIHLGGLREGRKAVILVSEGFSNTLPPQLRDPIAAMPGIGNPRRGMPGGQTDPREETTDFFAQTDMLSDLREVWDAANRANTAIYALDPRGLAGFEFDITEGVGMRTDRQYLDASMDTLRTLADQTDGRAIVNRNDLDTGLKQILRDTSTYYLLGYSSTEAPSDGKFHEIRVRVNRPGVQVRARKGYWALTAEETARVLAPPKPGPSPEVQAALTSIIEPPRGRTVRTWVGTERGENGQTRVTFVWEPVAPGPGGPNVEQATRVSLTASGSEGHPYFRGPVPGPGEDEEGSTGSGSATAERRGPSKVAFEARPGSLQLRVSVEGERGGVIDTDVREITVPDFTGTGLAVSTPVIFRARTAADLRRIRGEPDPVPEVSRDFRRTERLLIRFEAYGPGGAGPQVTARLLNRQGDGMTDVPVQGPPAAGEPHVIDLPLAGLPPGEYLLEIAARGAEDEAKELVAFRVGS